MVRVEARGTAVLGVERLSTRLRRTILDLITNSLRVRILESWARVQNVCVCVCVCVCVYKHVPIRTRDYVARGRELVKRNLANIFLIVGEACLKTNQKAPWCTVSQSNVLKTGTALYCIKNLYIHTYIHI